MKEQIIMPNPKKNKGIAIELIKKDMAAGKSFVTGVEMSPIWKQEKEDAIKKLLSGEHGNKVEFSGVSKSFYVTTEEPSDTSNILETIERDDQVIYLVVEELI
ncbi:MAG: hypothetical protein AUJ28_02270 [Parcubacteria group bacterium CG1_02_37_51]|uniref:Uncharacterized protein n=2 Tax=Candidatus Komeiliibacteriota TaxID=1817908 RepID=A0A2M8DS48_9BACT|nr:MAG: hypothetical protein AUJ28_02270 [Parcubacteria group bacterium CG1_02_37_51]PIY95197.1 MAG: hypothetical protein COY67_01235 [Candidatus Komeilibacteria bacterium CG_4_10_14_0_8_um_filter_37_78]PJC02203.1 MAG: hypothetical protein CO073_00725 [Candidatus Komeilibacteria bacterium CG_4_9_14_0_8_um_filter_36_9]